MAVPTITKTGSGSSKASGTTLAITVSTTSYALGDYVVCGFAMDPASGAVSFAKTAGTATVGSWTTIGDRANGSGTSGVRTVLAYAKVTAAGTITTITVTHPSVTARSGVTFNVTGADGTTPINCSTTDILGVGGSPSATPTTTGVDVLGLEVGGAEAVNGTTTNGGGASGCSQQGALTWTLSSADAASIGTTGGGGASNISIAYKADSTTALASTTIALSAVFAGSVTLAEIYAVFQAPTTVATIPQLLNRQAAVNRSANY